MRTYFARYAVLIALLGLSLTATSFAQEISQLAPGHYATDAIEKQLPFASGEQILIRSTANLAGTIRVLAEMRSTAGLVYIKQAKTNSRSRAFDYIDLISVSVEKRAGQLQVDLRAPNPAPWTNEIEAGLVELTISLPPDCDTRIEARYFDVYAIGPFRSFEVPSSLGRLEVERVTDKVQLTTFNQRLKAQDITGTISLSTTNAELLVSGMTAVKEAAEVSNDGGDISLEGVRGHLNVKNSFGRIDITEFTVDAKNSFIRGNSSPIQIEVLSMDAGQLIVNNRYEDIELTVPDSLSAFFTLSVDEDGKIIVENLPFETDLVRPNRLALRSGNADASISGSIRGTGNIFVHGVEPEELE